jgi:hypothetical protein
VHDWYRTWNLGQMAASCGYESAGTKKVRRLPLEAPLCVAWHHDDIAVGPRQSGDYRK